MSQEGEKLPRLVIVNQEWEDDGGDGDVLNAKDDEPPVGIVDPELRKMWHDFRAINKARPDRDLELPRNLLDDDVAIMLNAIARGQDAAGAQLALVMSKFFPLKDDDTEQADSSNQQQQAKPAEAVVKDGVKELIRSRSKEPKILAHSSQVTKVMEPKKKGRPSKAVLVSHQAPRCERLGKIASKKTNEEVAITPREIPKGRHKRAKSEVLPLMNNKRLSTPRERTTLYKMKLNPIWMPSNISLLDPPSSETDEVVQMTQTLGPDQDMAQSINEEQSINDEQSIPANDRQMDSSWATQPNSQNFGMMPRLVCYHGGVPHPFCGPLPNFMAPPSMHFHASHNQTTGWPNYASNFPGPQASVPMVNGWFGNGWDTQFMPPMAAPTSFYQPHPSVHQMPLPGVNGEKGNRY